MADGIASLTRCLGCAAFLLALAVVAPQAATATDAAIPRPAERLQELSEHLGLTVQQREAARPLVLRGIEQRRAVMDRYGVELEGDSFDRLSKREKRRVLGDLRAIDEQAEAQWREILSDAQFAEFKRLKDEARHRARARIMDSRMDSGR